MKPPVFQYHRPASLDEALALLAEHGAEAKPLAGGQSLVPTMNFRLAQPAVLIDLNRVPELAFLDETKGGVRIGAMTRQRVLERSDLIRARVPLVTETMPFIAHPQIRTRGTIGGSLAHADPAAELPVLAVVLQAKLRLQHATGDRWVPAREFYTGLFATALAEGELLVEIEIPPLAAGAGYAFLEVSRRHGDYALVGAAAVLEVDDAGGCRDARLGFLSVGDGPVLAEQAVQALQGNVLDDATLDEAAAVAADRDVDPPGDLHASAAYRRHLVGVLTRRVLRRALDRARGNGS